ncbi:MAG: adaptor protein MecA [Agathobacter sp.]|nr:adaptor protein MecA [Agathobacter sp.]
MKIEKVNENQIRCTLTKGDLADRQIKLSELAYGSEKAKELFRDMIQQANYEFGFEANDIPLMVEAIPLSSESIILVITKVEYPEELDTRFSRFTDPDEEDMNPEQASGMDLLSSQGADDILGLFRQMQKEKTAKEAAESETATETKPKHEKEIQPTVPSDVVRMYEFPTMESVEKLGKVLGDYYRGDNTLYKSDQSRTYELILHKSGHTPEEFNKICNIIAEYASQRKYTSAMEAHFAEHGKVLIKNNALQILSSL